MRHPTEEELPDKTYKVYLSANGKIFATSRDEDTLKVRTFGNSEPIAEIPFPESELISTETLALTGHRLAVVDRDRNIHVWERPSPSNGGNRRRNWEKCAVLIGHLKAIGALAFSPDGERLASISIDRTALLWDVDTGEQITEMDLPAPVGKRIGPYTPVGVAFSSLGEHNRWWTSRRYSVVGCNRWQNTHDAPTARRKSKSDSVMLLAVRNVFGFRGLVARRFAESAYPFMESKYW